MKITVNGSLCSGQGRCYTVAPDLLSADEYGFVTIRDQTIEVPAGQEAAAREAVAWCPELAISVVED